MLIYGTWPVVSTKDAIEILKRRSEDPLVQVVCLAVDTSTGLLTAYGVNKIIKNIPRNNELYSAVKTDKHPSKFFLMQHAEMDVVQQCYQMPPEQKRKIKIYVSLQPCINCLKALINAGFLDIEWMQDNRHQEEQKYAEPFLNMIKYKKNEQGFEVQIPSWFASEVEIESYFRNNRLY